MVRAVPIVHNNNNAMSSDESDDGVQDPLACNAPIIATGEEEVDENNNDYDANYYNGPFLGQQNNHPRAPSSSSFKKRHSSRKSSLKSNTTSPNGRSGLSPSSSSSRTRPVVKLLINSVSHTYSEPWRRQPQRESSGTGFLIRWAENVDATDDDNKNNSFQQTTTSGARYKPSLRILTNAHVVRNASTVRARASFGPHVVSCEVEWLSLPLDLALLKIAEGDWMDFCLGWNFDVANAGGEYYIDRSSSNALAAGDDVNASLNATLTRKSNNNSNSKKSNTPSSPPLTCLALSSLNLPKLDENVTCVGFPQGGTQISVTRGVVSRIDVNSQYELRIQIDAAINAGNSGGVSVCLVYIYMNVMLYMICLFWRFFFTPTRLLDQLIFEFLWLNFTFLMQWKSLTLPLDWNDAYE